MGVFYDDSVAYLQERQNADRARGASAYMRNQFSFYGVSSKEIYTLINEMSRKNRPTVADLRKFVHEAWLCDEREMQMVAVKLVRKHRDLLEEKDLALIKKMIVQKSWWDTVDEIAAQILGPLVKKYPELAKEMDVWIYSDNMWLRRSAILHQLQYKADTDFDKLFAYCDICMSEKEFFIRKAIGWALRQAARVDPKRIKEYVDQTPGLSPLSRREAIKHL